MERGVDLGSDPLDPRGDGTIRPGDPMWQAFMSGQPVLVNRRDDGMWDVQRFPADGDGRDDAGCPDGRRESLRLPFLARMRAALRGFFRLGGK